MTDSMTAVPTTELRWIQPKWNHRRYELRDGERVVAEFEYRGKWRPIAYLTLDGEELSFRGKGFLRTTIAVMRGEQEIAVFKQKARTGEMTFMNGRTFRWNRKSIWSTTFSFIAPDNEVLFTIKTAARWFRSEAVITVAPGGAKYPELRILFGMAWFQIMAAAQAGTAAT
jgi:hypothetical protein